MGPAAFVGETEKEARGTSGVKAFRILSIARGLSLEALVL